MQERLFQFWIKFLNYKNDDYIKQVENLCQALRENPSHTKRLLLERFKAAIEGVIEGRNLLNDLKIHKIAVKDKYINCTEKCTEGFEQGMKIVWEDIELFRSL